MFSLSHGRQVSENPVEPAAAWALMHVYLRRYGTGAWKAKKDERERVRFKQSFLMS